MHALRHHGPSQLHVAGNCGGRPAPWQRHRSAQRQGSHRYSWLQRGGEQAAQLQLARSSAGREDLPALSVEAARLPNQADTVFSGTENAEDILLRMPVADTVTKSVSDLDYLSVRARAAAPRHAGARGSA